MYEYMYYFIMLACMWYCAASVIYYLLRRNVNGFLGNISGNSNILIILKIVIIM